VDTFDVDFQHSFQPFKRQLVVWGFGYRFIHDALEGSYSVTLDPETQDYDIVSAFIQDEITLVPQHWRLTIGTKFEHNDFSGVEWQPSARLLWTPDDHQSLWAAASRAVRTPSRGEVANAIKIIVPQTYPLLWETVVNPDFDTEEVITYEIGYRIQPTANISFDLATFYNNYDNLRSSELIGAQLNQPPEPSSFQTIVTNSLKGDSYGIEAAVDWRPSQWWRLQWAYTYLDMDLKAKVETLDVFVKTDEKSSPQHQASARSFLDLSDAWQLDLWLRYVDELSAIDIESYIEMDVRLGWRVRPNTKIELVGKNLFDSHHPEYVSQYLDTKSTEVQRCVYGKVSVEF
jgi:iron complex outermembrane receptor protein